MSPTQLERAKALLYYLLLQKETNTITDNERVIMFHLSKDEKLQDVLSSKERLT